MMHSYARTNKKNSTILYTSNRLVMELALKTNSDIYPQKSSVCTIALAHGTELANRLRNTRCL